MLSHLRTLDTIRHETFTLLKGDGENIQASEFEVLLSVAQDQITMKAIFVNGQRIEIDSSNNKEFKAFVQEFGSNQSNAMTFAKQYENEWEDVWHDKFVSENGKDHY